MASTKISALPDGAPGQSTDALPIARAGSNFKLALADLAPGLAGTAASLSVGGSAATVTTAAQPAITSVGTLTTLGVSGTTNINGVLTIGLSGVADGQLKVDGAGGNLQIITGNATHIGVTPAGIQTNTDTSNTSAFKFMSFVSNGAEAGSITRVAQTAVVTFNTSSDYRIKDVFGLFVGASEKLRQFKVYDGQYKGDTVRRPMRIAHEVQAITPAAVFGAKDAMETVDVFVDKTVSVIDAETGVETASIVSVKTGTKQQPAYQKMAVGAQEDLLIAGWQEHDAIVSAMQKTIDALTARLDAAGIK